METQNEKQNPRPRIEFETECYMEGSWGSRELGRLKCSMELFDWGKQFDPYSRTRRGEAQIEFIAGNHVEHIGLIYDENKRITDYDGVFSVPQEAIQMLKDNGFNTEDIE